MALYSQVQTPDVSLTSTCRSLQVLANELREMCRKHNPAHRHRHIVHGIDAMLDTEEGFDTMVVPQVCTEPHPKPQWSMSLFRARWQQSSALSNAACHPQRAGLHVAGHLCPMYS